MKSLRALGITLVVVATGSVASCGADFSDAEKGGLADDSGANGTSSGGNANGGGGAGELPPEEELESNYSAPVATGTFVWIANPTSGRVAYINAATLEIRIVEAGNAPTYVAAVPDADEDVALVLNVLSKDATLLRAKGADLAVQTFDVPSSGNTWSVSSNGRFAIAWTDARRLDKADPVDGFQDITIIDLQNNTTEALTVGYRPVAIGFDQNTQRAFAVTQDGITVIELDGATPVVAKNIKLTDQPASDVTTRDVEITPDGSLALVRVEGEPFVGIVSLATGARADAVLPGIVTDLDLSSDGKVAVAVVRETGQVALLPVPGIFTNPLGFSLVQMNNALVGSASLAKNSPLAFLYTNAVPSSVLAVIDSSLTQPSVKNIQLWAPIQAVFPTDDASHALVLHSTEMVANSQYKAAMSVVPIALDLPAKLQGFDAPVASVALSPTGHRALVATGDATSSSFKMYVASMPSLQIQSYALASQPISAGIAAGANRGFVAQKHPDGRITFVDFNTGEVRTLTGFELASQVVDGSGEGTGTP